MPEVVSAQLAIAQPRRIKATHRRRRKVAAGRFVQRYYDPGVGRFLTIDPVGTSPVSGLNFNRYWYASNNPYTNTDPDGRCDGPSTCAIDRDIAAMNSGEMSRDEFMDRSEARATGAVAGLGLVLGGKALVALFTTTTGKSIIFGALSFLSRNTDDLNKLGQRVQKEQVARKVEAQKNAVTAQKPQMPAEPPKPPKPPEPPKPPKRPDPPKVPEP